jgi:glucosylceramidase
MKKLLLPLFLVLSVNASAQTFTQYTTTEQQPWQTKGKVSLTTKAKSQTMVNGQSSIANGKTFRAWGTCFNELGLDAISFHSQMLIFRTYLNIIRLVLLFSPSENK